MYLLFFVDNRNSRAFVRLFDYDIVVAFEDFKGKTLFPGGIGGVSSLF